MQIQSSASGSRNVATTGTGPPGNPSHRLFPSRTRPNRSSTTSTSTSPAGPSSASSCTGADDDEVAPGKRRQRELEEANWASLERILDRIDRVPSARPPPYVRGQSGSRGSSATGAGVPALLSLSEQRHAWPQPTPSPALASAGCSQHEWVKDDDGQHSTVVGSTAPFPAPQTSFEKARGTVVAPERRPRSARIESFGQGSGKARVRGLSDASIWLGLSAFASRNGTHGTADADSPTPHEMMDAFKLPRWRRSGAGKSPTVQFFDRPGTASSVHSDRNTVSSGSRASIDQEALSRSVGDLDLPPAPLRPTMLPRSASGGFGMHRASRKRELARQSSERLPSVRDHEADPATRKSAEHATPSSAQRLTGLTSLDVATTAPSRSPAQSSSRSRKRPLTAPVVDLNAFAIPSMENFSDTDAEAHRRPIEADSGSAVESDPAADGPRSSYAELSSSVRRRMDRRDTVTADDAPRLLESRSTATLSAGPVALDETDSSSLTDADFDPRSRTTSDARSFASDYHRVSLDVEDPSPTPSVTVDSSSHETASQSEEFLEEAPPAPSKGVKTVRRVESHITNPPQATSLAFDESLPARHDVLGASVGRTHTSIVAHPTIGDLLGDPSFEDPEARNWTGTFWVYILPSALSAVASATGRSLLSKAPLIRDVAGARKKLTKRDSSQLLQNEKPRLTGSSTDERVPDDLNSTGPGDTASMISDFAKESTASDKLSKGTPVGPEGSKGKRGAWKKNNVMVYRIYLPRLRRSDFRITHPSVFGKPHCAGIHRDRSFSPSSRPSSAATAAQPDKELHELLPDPPTDPIYVLMPTLGMLQAWLVVCKCYAVDETRTLYTKATKLLGSATAALTTDERGSHAEKMRVWRSLDISVLEGRGLAELSEKHSVREGKEKRNSGGGRRFDPTSSFTSIRSTSSEEKTLRTATRSSTAVFASTSQVSSTGSMSARHTTLDRDRDPTTGKARPYFCELVWARDMVARTAPKVGSTPFWSESFTFSDLGTLRHNALINVYQAHRNSKPTLVGTATIDVRGAARNVSHRLWLPVILQSNGGQYGELYVMLTVTEQVVMAAQEYSGLLRALGDDRDLDLPYNLASEVPGDLEKLAELLLRIYAYEDRLLLRLCQIAALDIDGDPTQAATLFRGNSLFTKMLDSYMRLVGHAWLDRSIGDVIRRICLAKVEVEIDPQRLKSSGREKALHENAKILTQWATSVWQGIYDSRSMCPTPLRQIFHKVQTFVAASYEDNDMRITSISAFLFLRYFVPAILNPRLFGLTPHQPEAGPQRTLTLLAKTLQGLANLKQFGTKEGWMSVMNPYIREHTEAFRDYISLVSKPSDSKKPEWTSPDHEMWALAHILRTSLPPQIREGIPKVPHLLDVYRDVALLAHLVSKNAKRATLAQSAAATTTRQTARSPKLESFVQECHDVDTRAIRRLAKLRTDTPKESTVSAGPAAVPSTSPPAPLQTPTTPKRRTRTEPADVSNLSPPLSTWDSTPTSPRDVREALDTLGASRARAHTVTSPARRPRHTLRQSFSSERLQSQPEGGRLTLVGNRTRPKALRARSGGPGAGASDPDKIVLLRETLIVSRSVETENITGGDHGHSPSVAPPERRLSPLSTTEDRPLFRHPFASSPMSAVAPACDDNHLPSGYVSLTQPRGSVQIVPSGEPAASKGAGFLRMIRKNSRAASG